MIHIGNWTPNWIYKFLLTQENEGSLWFDHTKK